MRNGISQPNRIEPPIGSTWQFYKIADGPLDIVDKEIEIFVEGFDEPIIGSNWRSNRPNSGEGYILNAYKAGVGHISILVLNEATYGGNVDTNGTYPLSGIFVPNGVRKISIHNEEVVHIIEPKYLPASSNIPSVIFNNFDGYGTIGIGYARFIVAQNTEIDVSISDESVIIDAYSELLHSTSENNSDMGRLQFNGSTGKVIVYPGAPGDITTVNATFLVTKDPNDPTQVKAIPTIITIVGDGSR